MKLVTRWCLLHVCHSANGRMHVASLCRNVIMCYTVNPLSLFISHLKNLQKLILKTLSSVAIKMCYVFQLSFIVTDHVPISRTWNKLKFYLSHLVSG